MRRILARVDSVFVHLVFEIFETGVREDWANVGFVYVKFHGEKRDRSLVGDERIENVARGVSFVYGVICMFGELKIFVDEFFVD